jgi:hypothetical protein
MPAIRFPASCALAAALCSLLVAASPAGGAILATIDATNPSAVVFTGTGAASAVSATGEERSVIFRGAVAFGIGYGRMPPSGIPNFFRSGDGFSFPMYTNSSSSLQLLSGFGPPRTFTAGSPAFLGTTTIDLSFMEFVHANLIGNVEVAYRNGYGTGEVLGQFQFIGATVPEPTALYLLASGAAAIATRRVRRHGRI